MPVFGGQVGCFLNWVGGMPKSHLVKAVRFTKASYNNIITANELAAMIAYLAPEYMLHCTTK